MWTPGDFILNGKYCDTQSVADQIEHLRELRGAEACVLLVFQAGVESSSPSRDKSASADRIFFQSLLLVAHRQNSKNSALQKALVSKYGREPISTFPVDDQRTTIGDLARQFPLPLFAQLPQHFEERQPVEIIWSETAATPLPETRFALMFINCSQADPDSVRTKLKPLQMRLGVMIAATVPILVHRNLELIRRVEKVIEDCERADASLSSGDPSSERLSQLPFSDALLRAALILTRSSVGNIYVSGNDPSHLVLEAQVNNSQPIGTLSLENGRSIVGYVYERKRPLLINDLASYEGSHADISYRWVGSPSTPGAYSEMAVPLMLLTLDPYETRAIGVINVERLTEQDGPFTSEDLTILRTIALRYSVRWAQQRAETEAKYLLELTKSQFGAFGTEQADLISEVVDPAKTIDRMDPRIPIELVLVHDKISAALQDCYELTRSRTATVRILSTDGAALVRFAAFPLEVMGHKHPAILLSERRSVNAWVANHGQECYIGDLNAPKPFRDYKGLSMALKARAKIRSEYCLPMFIRGRIVGTVNLESEYPHNYRSGRPHIAAIVEQIRLSILLAQNVVEHEVLSLDARSTLNSHELLKCSDAITSLANQHPDSPSHEMRRIAERIKRCIDEPFGVDDGGTVETAVSVGDLVNGIARERNIALWVRWRKQELSPDSVLVPGAYVRSARLALSELLQNAYDASENIPHSEITLSIRRLVRGGTTYAALRMVHPVRGLPDNARVRRMYRVPLVHSGRPHLGAFLAGSLIRRVGGDVWFEGDRVKGLGVTVMELPLR